MWISDRGHGAALARVGVAAGIGVVGGALAGLFLAWQLAVLAGWDLAALIYVGGIWPVIWRMDADRTAAKAGTEDTTRSVADLLLLSAAVASLIALVFVLLRAGHSKGAAQALQIALGIGSVVLSWATVHTTYTLRYAQLYYGRGAAGGVDFNQQELPAYSDFAYLAFTVGMTFQVSDTALHSREIRATVLRHALLSYLFGTVIVAMTINLIAGLGK